MVSHLLTNKLAPGRREEGPLGMQNLVAASPALQSFPDALVWRSKASRSRSDSCGRVRARDPVSVYWRVPPRILAATRTPNTAFSADSFFFFFFLLNVLFFNFFLV